MILLLVHSKQRLPKESLGVIVPFLDITDRVGNGGLGDGCAVIVILDFGKGRPVDGSGVKRIENLVAVAMKCRQAGTCWIGDNGSGASLTYRFQDFVYALRFPAACGAGEENVF